MLLSLSILVVVGGALAFKANSGTLYCTAHTVLIDGIITCPDFCNTQGRLMQGPPSDNICTTTTSGITADPCPSDLFCLKTNPGLRLE